MVIKKGKAKPSKWNKSCQGCGALILSGTVYCPNCGKEADRDG